MKRSLAVLGAIAFGAAPVRSTSDAKTDVAPSADAAPPVVVLLLNQTRRGYKNNVLGGLGIYRYGTSSTAWEDELRRALERTDIYGPFLVPTGCPGARIEDKCPAVRVIDDVQLPEAIAALKPSRLVLIRPSLSYSFYYQSFTASFVVHLLADDGHRKNTFRVVYRDHDCDVHCAQTSYPAAAYELAAMFRYMLELDIGYRTSAMPAEWRNKSKVKDFGPWSNRCVEDTDNDRIVRKYGLRLWLSPSGFELPAEITLVSRSWWGCNIFDVL